MEDGTPLTYDDAHGRCKMGRGTETCRYLGIGQTYTCLKGSTFQTLIDERVANDQIGAKGDNCSGAPDFVQQ